VAKVNLQFEKFEAGKQSFTQWYRSYLRTLKTGKVDLQLFLDAVAVNFDDRTRSSWKEYRRNHPNQNLETSLAGFATRIDRDSEKNLFMKLLKLAGNSSSASWTSWYGALTDIFREADELYKWDLSDGTKFHLVKLCMHKELWRSVALKEPKTLQEIDQLIVLSGLENELPNARHSLNAVDRDRQRSKKNKNSGGTRENKKKKGKCRNFGNTGKCKFGTKCRYKHAEACRNFQKGTCKLGENCLRFHPYSSANAVEDGGLDEQGL
jgi:nitroreductase